MENDFPNQTTNQLLIQHISGAAVFTDPCFAITACNPAASASFLYNQQDILGYSISFFIPVSSTTNSPPGLPNGGYLFIYKSLDAKHLLNMRETASLASQ